MVKTDSLIVLTMFLIFILSVVSFDDCCCSFSGPIAWKLSAIELVANDLQKYLSYLTSSYASDPQDQKIRFSDSIFWILKPNKYMNIGEQHMNPSVHPNNKKALEANMSYLAKAFR